MKRAWLVVLNWYGKSDTLELLSTLKHADLGASKILVVDNGSYDGTLEAIRENFPFVHTLQTGVNLGYAGGNNRGIAHAIEHGADVVGILNNDTLVEDGFWRPLVRLARSGLVAVSPDIRYADAPERSWFFGGVASRREGWVRHLQEHEQPTRDRPWESETLTGCCLVASAATWRRIGFFDEGLFLTFEDADWSMRARRRGARLIVDPTSRIQHKVSRSFHHQPTSLGLYYFCRNGLVFAARWLGPIATCRFLWRWIVRGGASEIRRHGLLGTRDLAMRVLALWSAVSGRRGRAGSWVNAVARWPGPA